jgi:hypothetical protein
MLTEGKEQVKVHLSSHKTGLLLGLLLDKLNPKSTTSLLGN